MPEEKSLDRWLVEAGQRTAPMPEVIATPRDAATVVLVRDGVSGLEVFLLRRVAEMAFAAGMTVFPGGGVDAADDTDVDWAGPGPSWWANRFGTDPVAARMLVVAAVRETFEECGVLLATGGDGLVPSPGEVAADRDALVAKELSFGGLMRRRALTLRADWLAPLAHWITPPVSVRRYSTHFFLAALPDGQEADGSTSEASAVAWVRPGDALEAWSRGVHSLLPPTWARLRELSSYRTVADAFAAERAVEVVGQDDAADPYGLTFDGSADYFAMFNARDDRSGR